MLEATSLEIHPAACCRSASATCIAFAACGPARALPVSRWVKAKVTPAPMAMATSALSTRTRRRRPARRR